jgi:hypothetical protein
VNHLGDAYPEALMPWSHNKLLTGFALDHVLNSGTPPGESRGGSLIPLSWYTAMDEWIRGDGVTRNKVSRCKVQGKNGHQATGIGPLMTGLGQAVQGTMVQGKRGRTGVLCQWHRENDLSGRSMSQRNLHLEPCPVVRWYRYRSGPEADACCLPPSTYTRRQDLPHVIHPFLHLQTRALMAQNRSRNRAQRW